MGNSFRLFRVINTVVESDIIMSFYFQPIDEKPLWKVKPGQYLTLNIPTYHSDKKVLLKTYSLSNDSDVTGSYRITVKRETGLNDAPNGIGSNWLHDHLKVGDEIQIAPPRGTFFLDQESLRPVLLLSGGVGLTPLVSMLHRLSKSNRKVYFLHACENGQVHALRDEVNSLNNERIKSLFVYRNPSSEDEAARRFDHKGVIDTPFLRKHLPKDNYDVYLCGPTPFMKAMYQLSLELGVPKNQIAYEFFGKASSIENSVETAALNATSSKAAAHATPIVAALANITNPEAWAEPPLSDKISHQDLENQRGLVTFKKSNKTVHWNESYRSLLELAEHTGLKPDFSCRSGVCSTCTCKLLEGQVHYIEEALVQPNEGEILICCSKPVGPVVLDI